LAGLKKRESLKERIRRRTRVTVVFWKGTSEEGGMHQKPKCGYLFVGGKKQLGELPGRYCSSSENESVEDGKKGKTGALKGEGDSGVVERGKTPRL